MPLPVAHWVEPAGVLAFHGTGPAAQVDWLDSPEPALAGRMERALRTIRPAVGNDAGPLATGESGLDQPRYRAAFDRVHSHILRGDVYELNLCREIHGALPDGWCPDVAFDRNFAPLWQQLGCCIQFIE